MATFKGRGVVYDASGTVTIAGVAQVNTAANAEVTDRSEVRKLKDAKGKTQTLVVPEVIKSVSVELIPGGTTATSATVAEAKAQGVLPTKLSSLVLSGFSISSFNDNYVIDEDSSVRVTSDGELTVSVRGTRYERDFTQDSSTTTP